MSKADFTASEIYFSNISKGTASLPRGILQTDPMAKDVIIKTRCLLYWHYA